MIAAIKKVEDSYNGERKTIEEWLAWEKRKREELLGLDKVGKFAYFSAALLQRAMRGEMFEKRAQLFAENFRSEKDIIPKNIERLLKEKNCYRWTIAEGVKIVMDVKRTVFSKDFFWDDYFDKAKREANSGFKDDLFLKMKGVGQKVRDFALSLFLDEYLAVDVHIKRVLKRWGVEKSEDYGKVKEAARRLAESVGLSMWELDRVLWHFGRAVCESSPKCKICPVRDDCEGVK